MAIAGIAFAATPRPAAAAAGDNCVKVLGYEWSGEKQSMDPADMHSGDDAYHTFAVYNRLVDVDDNFKVLPELATEWSVSPDNLTWTFKLRQGVKFHSGKDLSSADVVYTFKRLLDPTLASGAQSVLEFLDADGIKAPDPYTVTFTTKKPVVELPVLITNKFTNIEPDGAKHADLELHEDGTGPFMQDQFTPNAPVRILKKNPNYWDAGRPKSDCLRITVAQEAVAAVSAIKAGQVDLVLNVDPSVISALKGDPNVQLLQTAASNSMTIAMWVDTKPFDDNRVREALKLSVDRQAMVDTVLLGFGETGADSPVPIANPASYTAEAPKQDIAKAKQLLADAGYPTGLKFDMYTRRAYPAW
jgi:peptide/nickel transport system substrate-binding protein